jgi:hypothetical protein
MIKKARISRVRVPLKENRIGKRWEWVAEEHLDLSEIISLVHPIH